jgi:hypothetical protein
VIGGEYPPGTYLKVDRGSDGLTFESKLSN